MLFFYVCYLDVYHIEGENQRSIYESVCTLRQNKKIIINLGWWTEFYLFICLNKLFLSKVDQLVSFQPIAKEILYDTFSSFYLNLTKSKHLSVCNRGVVNVLCAYYYSIILASNMYSEYVSVHRIAHGTNCVSENEFYGNFYHP